MQRKMLAAVHATEEQLIAPRYMMQISTHLAPNVYCSLRKTLFAIYWMHLRVNLICIKIFCLQKKTVTHAVGHGKISVAVLTYLMFINDVSVTSS